MTGKGFLNAIGVWLTLVFLAGVYVWWACSIPAANGRLMLAVMFLLVWVPLSLWWAWRLYGDD